MLPSEAVYLFADFYARDTSPQRRLSDLVEVFCKLHKLQPPSRPMSIGNLLAYQPPTDPPRGG